LESGITKIYGAGILSSVAEIENIQNHDHFIFDWQQVIHDNPLITEMQKHYYIIHSLDDLKNRMKDNLIFLD
jgi:phenylalanine-4-hydroxylase